MKRLAWAMACAAAVAGCDAKPPEPVKRGSAPMREVTENPAYNPIPIIDPTGSYVAGKSVKRTIGVDNNLRQIHLCMMQYELTRGGYPGQGAFFKDLIESGSIPDYRICMIPKTELSRDEVIKGKKGTFGVTADRLTGNTPSDKPIAWEPEPINDTRIVLSFGGEVREMQEADFLALKGKHEGK